jgi:EAL domain-containing protein (putative c-di-GMP-specific phosphodiesterase class I)
MERTALERDLETAISEQAFDMVLQVQRTVETGKLVGAEALIRWCHPERGMVPPSEFLPIAASNGMLPAIGRFMMDRAIQIAAQVNKGREDTLTIAVNIGIEELNEEGFAPSIIAILEKHGAVPSWLEIEITESTAMEESGLVDHQVAILSDIGVRFAIDDFGMGYSNLGRMRALAFQTLKLDRSLMIGLGEDPACEHLVATIMDMAQAIGADVVAEGIETIEQLDVLKRRGCGTYQGYLGGRPMPAEDFVALVGDGTDHQLKVAS